MSSVNVCDGRFERSYMVMQSVISEYVASGESGDRSQLHTTDDFGQNCLLYT